MRHVIRLAGVAFLCAMMPAGTAAGQGGSPPTPATPGSAAPGQIPRRPAPARTPARDGSGQEVAGTSVLRGRVVSGETGAPLRRAVVQAFASERRANHAVTTDADGRFEIRELPVGRYSVTASKGGYVTLQFGQRRPFEPGRPIELADGQTLQNVDFTLPRGGVITGRLVDEFGEPVANAMVQTLRYRYTGGTRRATPTGGSVETNDIGQFRVFGLSPGEYYVTAMLRNGGAAGGDASATSGYAPTYYPGTPVLAEAQALTVSIGGEVNADFALMPARLSRVSGFVTDSTGRALTDAFVMLRSSDMTGGFGGARGRVRADGSFTVPNVAPGEYALIANTRPGESGEAEFAMQTLAVGGDITGITLTTTKGGVATGQIVTDAGDAPAFDLTTVRLFATLARPAFTPFLNGNNSRSTVLADGTFELRNLFDRQTIRAQLPTEWNLTAVRMNGIDVTDTGIDFSANPKLAGLQIVVSNRVTELSGGVTDQRGVAVGDFTVIVFAEDAQRWMPPTRFVSSARPDQEGRFKIRGLPAARYLAVAVEYVEQGGWNDPEFLERVRPSATAVELGVGESKSLPLKLVSLP